MELIGSEAELGYDITDNEAISDDHNNSEQHSAYIPYDLLTPSEIAGMTQTEEKSIRCFLMSIIQEIGIILRINNATVLTAMNIANHFYLKKPFTLYEPICILSASIFLAGKTEENVKKPSDILSAALYVLAQRRRGGSEEDISVDYSHLKNFAKMKESIYNAELVILKELAYDLHSLGFHPHCLLLHYIKKISDDSNLLKQSWGFLNDMYRTSLTANYSPNALACSAIFIASRKYYIALPRDVPWWEVFETSLEQIEEIIAETLKLYELYSGYELFDVRKVFKRLKYQKERAEEEKVERRKHHRHRHRHKHRHHHHRSRSRSRSKTSSSKHRKRHSHHRHKSHSRRSRSSSSLDYSRSSPR